MTEKPVSRPKPKPKPAAKPAVKEPEMGAARALVAKNPNAVTAITGGGVTSLVLFVATKLGVTLDIYSAIWIGAGLTSAFMFLSEYGLVNGWYRILRGKNAG